MIKKIRRSALLVAEFSCGLFGVSDDFVEKRLSLDEKFQVQRDSVFFVRAVGDSMMPLIFPNDILVVDRSIDAKSGNIITFHLNGNPLCKKLIKSNGSIILRSLNPSNDDILINVNDTINIFGVVIGVSRDLL